MFIIRPLRYWFILIFASPGQGKSLEQAYLTFRILKELKYTEKKFPYLPKRLVLTNQRLNLNLLAKKFEINFLNSHIVYWQESEELRYCPRKICFKQNGIHDNHDVDIFVDEGALLFPPEEWKNTPKWLRKMWMQHRHRGIRIVMLTQDYQAIDINARRMVWRAYHVKKIIGSRDPAPTLPLLYKWNLKNLFHPFKNVVWGIIQIRNFDPMLFKQDTLQLLKVALYPEEQENLQKLKLMGFSKFRLITWFKINLYDTLEDVKSNFER